MGMNAHPSREPFGAWTPWLMRHRQLKIGACQELGSALNFERPGARMSSTSRSPGGRIRWRVAS